MATPVRFSFRRLLRRLQRRHLEASRKLRKQRAHFDYEIPGHQQRPNRKYDIAREPHPLPQQRGVVEVYTTRICESVFEHGIELRPADRKEIQEDPQHQSNIMNPQKPSFSLNGARSPAM